MVDDLLRSLAARQPYPLLFATISGAHLYGFPSPDSDFDLRGVHVLPAREVLGLFPPRETNEQSCVEQGREMDIVTHDARKFFSLMLKPNGYVLEQLFSPLVVYAGPEFQELKRLGGQCVTRHHAFHYLGFVKTQWKLFEKEPRTKPLLYVFRVLLTGIHLMRTGRVEANIVTLNEVFRLSYVDELVAAKRTGAEKAALPGGDVACYEREYLRLTGELEAAQRDSRLPEHAAARDALSDLLLRLRGVA
ncbi:MAG: DNA polymerase beta superfamily protein [Phycisphaerae bacterium]